MSTSRKTTAPARPPLVMVVRAKFDDFEAFAQTIDGWGLDWVQLDRGSLEVRLRQVGTPSALLTRFFFGRKFHQRGTSPPGFRTFGVNGSRSPALEWPDRTGSDSEIVVFPSGDEFDCVSHQGFYGDTVSIAEDRIREVADQLGFADPLDDLGAGRSLVETDPDLIESMRVSLSVMHSISIQESNAETAGAGLAETEFDLIEGLIRALAGGGDLHSRPPGANLRSLAVRRALEYIEERADEAPTVEEICRASGASWRTLNYAFRDRFGVTPKQYLQKSRLQRVRRDLLRKDRWIPISRIAARWGFWHMGQFAADYRRQFGELPSETPRRA